MFCFARKYVHWLPGGSGAQMSTLSPSLFTGLLFSCSMLLHLAPPSSYPTVVGFVCIVIGHRGFQGLVCLAGPEGMVLMCDCLLTIAVAGCNVPLMVVHGMDIADI